MACTIYFFISARFLPTIQGEFLFYFTVPGGGREHLENEYLRISSVASLVKFDRTRYSLCTKFDFIYIFFPFFFHTVTLTLSDYAESTSILGFSLPVNFRAPSSFFSCANKFYNFTHYQCIVASFAYWQLMNISLSLSLFLSLSFSLTLSLSFFLSLKTPSQLVLYIICSTKECVY